MRPWTFLMLVASTACTISNPEFGGTSSTGTSSMPSTTGTTGTDTTVATTNAETADASSSTTSGRADSSTTTGEVDRHCCGVDDCTDTVRECMCGLSEACCQVEWGETCQGIAIACGGRCDGDEPDCCVPQPTPACFGVALEPSFCLTHAACCLDQWTPQCVADYDHATGSCELGDCNAAHDSPGCSSGDVMTCLCAEGVRPQCCTETWDETCVAKAQEVCGA